MNESKRDEGKIRYRNPTALQPEELEELLERFVRLATLICDVPVAMVNWMDENQQKTLAAEGIAADQIPPGEGLCKKTLEMEEVFEVSNIQGDSHFEDCWYLRCEPPLVFYAGIALVDSAGRRMGTLCVMDYESRRLSEKQRTGLQELGSEAAERLELYEDFWQVTYAAEQKNELMRVVSHDLRNPIMGIVSAADMILTESEIDEGMNKDILGIVKNSGEQMYAVVSEFLDNELGSFDRVSNQPETLDPVSLLRQIVRLYQFMARSKQITVDWSIEGELPMVKIDKRNFFQIIGNILSNAIKFSNRNSTVGIRIQFEQQQNDEGTLIVSVKDEGIGIPKDLQNNLFELNGEGRKGTAGEPSYGLGLYIVKKLLDVCDGSINIDSTVEQGTAVEVQLPVEVSAVNEVGQD